MMVPMMIFVLMMSIACSCQGQMQSLPMQDKVYASVPASNRESLRNVVEKFVALQTAGDWDEVYDLLDNQRNLSREQFVREMQGNRLARFIPQSATFIPPEGTWVITGCGFFQPTQTSNGKGVFSSVYARKVGNGWRLTPAAIVLLKDEPHGTRPCVPE